MAHHIDETRLNAREARQGPLGLPVLKVLIAALVLAAVAWAGTEFWGRTTSPAQPAGEITTSPPSTPRNPTGSFDNDAPAGTAVQPAQADRSPTLRSSTGSDTQQISPDGTAK